MAQRGSATTFANQLITTVLRSPFHFFVSSRSLLITVKGRKTGRLYTLPVNFMRQGDLISIVSQRHRTWWRNLRGGAPVTLRIGGRDVQGYGTVVEDDAGVAAALAAAFAGVRRPPRRYRDPATAAKTRVIVQVRLGSSSAQ